ncbi:hypothetical protein BOX15_Mlig031563g1 [Macrostomum lignano]|uniref:Uncharacterized protein n=2 Tax=Macrostomum lignano TaxID=282301 RepID=A0A267FAP9_9PLAT|nr:hypothetical protein BOX15_Mlig031563g1 [Macrostomum lignano]
MATSASSALANGHSASVNCLALDHDSSLLASGADDAAICLWDAGQRLLTAKWQCGGPAGAPVVSLAFSSPGFASGRLLFAAQGSAVHAWDLRSPAQPLLSICAAEDEVNSVALLEEERRLATADDTGAVKIFDAVSGELVRALHKHDNIASAVIFRPTRTWHVISGGMDYRLVVTDWKGHRGEAVNIFDMSELQDAESTVSASGIGVNPPLVHCLAASSDGQFVAAGLENGSVELFSGSGRHLLQSESLYGHSAGVSALLCLPGHLLLSGGNDRRCYLWALDSEQAGASFAHSDKVNALCGTRPDRVFVADSGSTVHCCDLSAAA